MYDNQSVKLNRKKLKQMTYEILKVEQANLKTRERPKEAMVELLRRIIIDEVNKTY